MTHLERSLADRGAKLQVDMQMKRKEFLEREAYVYYDVYEYGRGGDSRICRTERDRAGVALQRRADGSDQPPVGLAGRQSPDRLPSRPGHHDAKFWTD